MTKSSKKANCTHFPAVVVCATVGAKKRNIKCSDPYPKIDICTLEHRKSKKNTVEARSLILDPRSQRAGSYKFGAVIVNV